MAQAHMQLMTSAFISVVLAVHIVIACASETPRNRINGSALLDILVMADIGHSREHADRLTTPSAVMGKSAFEGAFSLYDGLADFVLNQGMRPHAVIIAGDIAYVGGSASGLNDTRQDFQKYLAGQVSPSQVFPIIGNHDLNYLGCMIPSMLNPFDPICYYGEHHHLFASAPNLSFNEWRANWLQFFPGLHAAIIPRGVNSDHAWLPPLRYNIDMRSESSVYFIMGLISGAFVEHWGPMTPADAVDAQAPGGEALECAFLRDSLTHGRSLNKTIFIYVTHDFKRACSDWSLIQQIDVWIYGHVHNAWQSLASGSMVVQEQRYYPIRLLLGNGGFDNGLIDAVSFGRVHEELLPQAEDGSGERVRLHFDIYDTCESTKLRCPSTDVLPADLQCWKKCKDFPGGYDSGGGPRKALPTKHDLGFILEAPRRPPATPKAPPKAPFGGAWTMQVHNGTSSGWIALGTCGTLRLLMQTCLVLAESEEAAAVFAFYDVSDGAQSESQLHALVSVRLAVVADPVKGQKPDGRGPVKDYGSILYEAPGFWDGSFTGIGDMRSSDGRRFEFQQSLDQWTITNVSVMGGWMEGAHFTIATASDLEVTFHTPYMRSPVNMII